MENLTVRQPPRGADLWNHFVLLSAAKVCEIRSRRIHFNSAVEGDKRRHVLCLCLSVNIIDTLKSTIRCLWHCIMQSGFNEHDFLFCVAFFIDLTRLPQTSALIILCAGGFDD